MSWFFSDPARAALLIAEAESWRGTPFRRFSQVKGPGGGTDCVGFCEGVMVRVGAVEPFSFPRNLTDYGRKAHNDRILQYLRGEVAEDPQSTVLATRFDELNLNACPLYMAGDLVILNSGRGMWHMPLMLGERAFMQCASPDGVSEGDITQDLYASRIAAVFRAKEMA